jgi:hypothetical protein
MDRCRRSGQLLRSIEIGDTVVIFTARIWPGHYTRPLAVSLANKSRTKF